MPRILITGNGFDLHHKLPTTYKDFIKIVDYISQNHNSDFENVYKNSDSFAMIKDSFSTDIKFDQNNIELITETANKNILFNFFKNELEIDTWIDFENKIEYLLENIFYSIRTMRETISSVGPIHPNSILAIKTKLNNNIIFAKILNFLKIINVQNEGFTINEKFLVNKYGYNIDFDEDKIINSIYSQLIEFRKLFNLYIQTFVVPLYEKYNSNDHLSQIFKNINYYFTFNYTPTFEKLYDNKEISVNYLHGKSEAQKENIVFGISELFNEECHKSEYIKFTKYFQKFNNRTDFYFLNQLKKSDSENYIFYFWGHSLDKSDSSYINEVFDFIDNVDSKIKRIVIIYHNESSRTKSLLNLFNIRSKKDMEMKIRNKILVFLQNNSNELANDLNENIINPPLQFSF
ncbi:MAG: bacteriophage abortive infection AbiH family protein [Chryseobacterium sp.]|uniref:AbiH family protein n=1 Tax=Chryseobacterium sp. TaxID=1871047 RepID=UPI0025BBDCD5|nr:AbiH family protein [Chryseobacterium sp.]MCJ7933323.1 bacteriophage abortive infection AbiH family protein [Chryseobacterium sp.]